MADKLQRIFEYRVLLASAQRRGGVLEPEARARLERLGKQLPLAAPALDERDPYTLLGDPLQVEYAHAGQLVTGHLCNASAGGFAISVAEPPPLGEELLVHVQDRRHGVVFAFPALVVSRVLRGIRGMTVAFEGTPSKTGPAPSSGVFVAARSAPGAGNRDFA